MRRNLKRVIGLSLATMMCAGLVACGKSDTGATAEGAADLETQVEETAEAEKEEAAEETTAEEITGEITVLTHRTDLIDTKFADYKKAFEAKYPGTTVKFEPITDYESDVAIRMQTTEYGDVLCIPNSVRSTEFSNFFEPLGTVEELSEKYEEKYLYTKQSEGTVYGLASCANAQGVVYNKKVFEQAGITTLPTTPEEFLECLKQIGEKTEAIPYYTNYAAGWTLTAWQDHAWGTATGDADYHNNGIVNETDPFSEGKSNYVVHKLMYDIVANDLCEADPTTTDWEACKGMLNRGEIGCMVLGSWAISQMQAADANPDDIGYMPFPVNIDGKQYATAGADYTYAINSNSKNKATARAWIDYMIDESGFAVSEGSINILKGDPLPESLKDFDGIELVVDAAATPENEGKFDTLSQESEINLYADTEKKRIVEAAMGSTSESFDDIMNDWNTKWAEALENY